MPRMLTILATITLLFTGCTGPEQPTYSCTPETGGAPFPCYKAQWELYQKQDRLYTEAETVHAKFLAEEERIHRSGGVTRLTPILEETTTGDFRKGRLMYYTDLAKSNTYITDGHFRTAWIKRKPSAIISGSAVAMEACLDGHTVTFHEPGSKAWKAGYLLQTYQFVHEGNGLKISAASGEQRESC